MNAEDKKDAVALMKEFDVRPDLESGFIKNLHLVTVGLFTHGILISSGAMQVYNKNPTERRRLKEWLKLNFNPLDLLLGDITIQIKIKKRKHDGRVVTRKYTTHDMEIEFAVFKELLRIHELPMERPSGKPPSAATLVLSCYRPLAKFLLKNGMSKNKIATLVECHASKISFIAKVSRQHITKGIF